MRWRPAGDIFGDIADDTSKAKPDRASRLLLKAIRSLPEREQDAVLAHLLDRALLPDPGAVTRQTGRSFALGASRLPRFPGSRIELGPSASWRMRDAALILDRLAAGTTTQDLARVLAMEPDLLHIVLRDVARGSHVSDRLSTILQQLADGRTIGQISEKLGLAEEEVSAELEPTEESTATVCSMLMARAALPSPPLGIVGTSGPLRTMPVRFPEQQYERLKTWCEEHNFPMAVVVRGVVERFLDEQQKPAA